MNTNEIQVIMLEIFKVAKVIHQQDCDDFTLGHISGAIRVAYTVFR
ncbi:MAG: hypothetical protein LBL57_03355 [Tannerella sp.]|nr:hypothetical protein [Tannerella sp.]